MAEERRPKAFEELPYYPEEYASILRCFSTLRLRYPKGTPIPISEMTAYANAFGLPADMVITVVCGCDVAWLTATAEVNRD